MIVLRSRLLAIALLVALTAGCGGGGGRLSHASLVTRVDALCKSAVAKVKTVKKPASLAELPAYLQQIRPIQAHFLDQARKLRPPLRDEHDWKLALAFDERILHEYDLMTAAARRGDEKTVSRIGRRLAALPGRNPYEVRLGMKGC